MDIYSDFFSSVMPDVALAAPLHDTKEMAPAELVSIVKKLRKYSCLVAQFVEGSHTASCTNFTHYDWDRHFEEKLNDTIHSIPLETFKSRCYPVEKLVWMGWAVLAVYHLDAEKSERFLSTVVRKLLNEKLSKKSAEFFNKICEKKDNLHLPLNLFEDIVTISPSYIESLIVDVVHGLHTKPLDACQFLEIVAFFQKPNMKSWLKSCSQSPKIFQVFVSIINTLLLHSKGDSITVAFVQEFHLVVRKLLPRNSSIAVLYPNQLQSLVVHLDKPPEYHSVELTNTKREKILEILLLGLTCDRNETLCLLSHFPLWIPNLFRYGIAKGEARVFSNCFLEEDCKPYLERLETSRDVKEKCELFMENNKA